MKMLVLALCLVGSVLGSPYHHAYDTPEVAHAKAAHLATLAKAHQEASERSWSTDEDDGSYKEAIHGDHGQWDGESGQHGQWQGDSGHHGHHEQQHHSVSWNTPAQSWSHEGQHQQWHQAPAPAYQHSHYEGHEKKWTGPVALPPGYDKNGAPLPVQDTPEVLAEKAKHFHLYAHGAHAAAAHHGAQSQDSPSWAPHHGWQSGEGSSSEESYESQEGHHY
ncbi:Hypothetical protein NTJ_09745 [Nesidiocoris tenuis]|uniref:Uncharacterized protein n=1 Tax=Nesidiocoris tenuis TaxID=355587 RepID=A0ABN7B199_9HEMI|nr:Hypothetical protein NTJ_09745 [Nesidiocoris tenuis]